MQPIRSVELLVEKIRRDYAGDISLVAVMGSYVYDDTHARSDIDMFFVPKTERGFDLAMTFIIDGIGYDFWAISWERLENIASHQESVTSIIYESRVLYYGAPEDEARFERLRERALDTGYAEKFAEMAAEKLALAYQDYFYLQHDENIADARLHALGLLRYVSWAIALLNQDTIKRGRGKIRQEILAMAHVPDGFEERYDTIFETDSVAGMQEACAGLLRETDWLIGARRDALTEKRPFAEVFHQFYEEMINAYNKIERAREIGDPVTALYAAVELRYEIGNVLRMADVESAELPDLVGAFTPDDLDAFAEAARAHQAAFEALLRRHNTDVRYLEDMDALEKLLEAK